MEEYTEFVKKINVYDDWNLFSDKNTINYIIFSFPIKDDNNVDFISILYNDYTKKDIINSIKKKNALYKQFKYKKNYVRLVKKNVDKYM